MWRSETKKILQVVVLESEMTAGFYSSQPIGGQKPLNIKYTHLVPADERWSESVSIVCQLS